MGIARDGEYSKVISALFRESLLAGGESGRDSIGYGRIAHLFLRSCIQVSQECVDTDAIQFIQWGQVDGRAIADAPAAIDPMRSAWPDGNTGVPSVQVASIVAALTAAEDELVLCNRYSGSAT